MMTESLSYAEWFTERYGVDPVVIRNIPRKINKPFDLPENHPKIMLYQGAINQSRGIPQAIMALKLLDDVVFKIGEIVENHDPHNIARKVKIVLDNGRAFYQTELEKAAEELCWENEESKILDLFNKVVQENF